MFPLSEYKTSIHHQRHTKSSAHAQQRIVRKPSLNIFYDFNEKKCFLPFFASTVDGVLANVRALNKRRQTAGGKTTEVFAGDIKHITVCKSCLFSLLPTCIHLSKAWVRNGVLLAFKSHEKLSA